MAKLGLVYTTVGSSDDAQMLARNVVEKKLAACVNVFPGVMSVYEWDGKVTSEFEVGMVFKVAATKVQDLVKWLEENHPYDVPALIWGEGLITVPFMKFVSK